jgi:hypothetical protein
MNKNFTLGAIFLFLFVFVCLIYGMNSMNNRYVPAEYVVIANQIIAEVEASLTKRYKMQAISSTSGMADCFNVVGLGFKTHLTQNASVQIPSILRKVSY